MNKSSSKEQIRNLLIVIGLALAFSTGIVLWLIQGARTSTYQVNQVLLSPEVARTLVKGPFTFDKIVYTEWNSGEKAWKSRQIDLGVYTQFYSLVQNLQAKSPVTPEMEAPFARAKPAELNLYVHQGTQGKASASQLFQVVQFVQESDFFRVEMRLEGQMDQANWSYFYLPGIASTVSKLFTPSSEALP